MSVLSAVRGVVVRDLVRAFRQKGRLVGGLIRPFMWLVLVGTGTTPLRESTVSRRIACSCIPA